MEVKVEIVEVKKENLDEVKIFFKATLTETYERHGIDSGELEEELAKKIAEVEVFLDGSRKDLDFILARDEGKVIGIIKSSKTGKFSNKITEGRVRDIKEIGSLYIHPERRGNGIGSRLIEEMLRRLKEDEEELFCFDCGFPDSQKRWIKKFGEPTTVLENYWDKGVHHMLWIRKVGDYLSGQ